MATIKSTAGEQPLKSHGPESLQSIATTHPSTLSFQQRPSVKQLRSALITGEKDLPFSLTSTTLAGSGMISCPPYIFTDDETGSLLAFYHLGRKMAGHACIVHGGVVAVLLDECMGRACFPRLAGRIGVTAKLDLSYKSPIAVDSVILIRADTVDVQGRKAFVRCTVEDAQDGRVLVESTALFIEPRWASEMPPVI
jgi:acyl-coenzyme A thioesterase PaaI-like protein